MMEHTHSCEFRPNGRDFCSKEATRQFWVGREYPQSGSPLGEELYICEEHIPEAIKLWEAQCLEWKEITDTQTDGIARKKAKASKKGKRKKKAKVSKKGKAKAPKKGTPKKKAKSAKRK